MFSLKHAERFTSEPKRNSSSCECSSRIRLPETRVLAERLESRMLLSTWSMEDSYLPGGAMCMAQDAGGDLFAAGYVYDAAGHTHGVIRAKWAAQSQWQTAADYFPADSRGVNIDALYSYRDGETDHLLGTGSTTDAGTGDTQWLTVKWKVISAPDSGQVSLQLVSESHIQGRSRGSDVAGYGSTIYMVGSCSLPDTVKGSTIYQDHWLVKQSTDGGESWNDIQIYQPVNGQLSHADDVAVVPDASAPLGYSVYVTGGAPSLGKWIVQRYDGSGWAIVDNYSYDPKASMLVYDVGADAQGNIYVVGRADQSFKSGTKGTGIVRRSTDRAKTWQVVDLWQTNLMNTAYCFGTDAAGKLYVGGSGMNTVNRTDVYHTVVRSSADGVHWSPFDDWAGESNGGPCNNLALLGAADGNLYVAGFATNVDGGRRWVVRSWPAPTASQSAPLAATAMPSSSTTAAAPAAATAGPAKKTSPFSTRSILLKKRPAARVHAKGVHAH